MSEIFKRGRSSNSVVRISYPFSASGSIPERIRTSNLRLRRPTLYHRCGMGSVATIRLNLEVRTPRLKGGSSARRLGMQITISPKTTRKMAIAYWFTYPFAPSASALAACAQAAAGKPQETITTTTSRVRVLTGSGKNSSHCVELISR